MAIIHKSYGNTVLKGDLFLVGQLKLTNSSYLFKLTASGTVSATPAGIVAGATRKKLKVLVDDTAYYLLAASDWVSAGSESVSPSSSRSPSSSPSASVSPSS